MKTPYQEAKLLLVKKISRKSYSIVELRSWMSKQGVASELTEQLLHEFEQLGYLNDEAWLTSFVAQQRALRYGPRRIGLKLLQKGFTKEQIASAIISTVSENSDELALIRQLLRGRYRSRNLSEGRDRQKVIVSLMRRGFNIDNILKLVGDL